jgi:hypothetical protein
VTDDTDDDFVRHLDSLGVPHPLGRGRTRSRYGLDRNTEEGALLAFSGALRRSNPTHRVVAWVLLFAVGLPGCLTLLWLLGQLTGV